MFDGGPDNLRDCCGLSYVIWLVTCFVLLQLHTGLIALGIKYSVNLKVLNQFVFLLVSFQIKFAKNPNLPGIHDNMLACLCNFCM